MLVAQEETSEEKIKHQLIERLVHEFINSNLIQFARLNDPVSTSDTWYSKIIVTSQEEIMALENIAIELMGSPAEEVSVIGQSMKDILHDIS